MVTKCACTAVQLTAGGNDTGAEEPKNPQKKQKKQKQHRNHFIGFWLVLHTETNEMKS